MISKQKKGLNGAATPMSPSSNHFDDNTKQHPRGSTKTRVRTLRFRVAGGRTQTVQGQVARTLDALIRKGRGGVTCLDLSGWALRLSAYIFILRKEHGLSIDTEREPHDGGVHGRYVLKTPVEIEPEE